MNDLINRQDAIDAVAFGITYVKVFDQETCEVFEPFKQENEALNNAIDRIKKLSPADAVKVVKCKDCRQKLWTCCTRFVEAFVTDEDYCSKGERREYATD